MFLSLGLAILYCRSLLIMVKSILIKELFACPVLIWIYIEIVLQTPVSELPESLSEFEFPPSPPSSYDNQCFNDDDFSRPPPDLPPQLRETVLNEPSCCTSGHQSGVQPRHTELNHLYQNNVGGEFMALGSTFKFCEKYVTMLLFKPLLRRNW